MLCTLCTNNISNRISVICKCTMFCMNSVTCIYMNDPFFLLARHHALLLFSLLVTRCDFSKIYKLMESETIKRVSCGDNLKDMILCLFLVAAGIHYAALSSQLDHDHKF